MIAPARLVALSEVHDQHPVYDLRVVVAPRLLNLHPVVIEKGFTGYPDVAPVERVAVLLIPIYGLKGDAPALRVVHYLAGGRLKPSHEVRDA